MPNNFKNLMKKIILIILISIVVLIFGIIIFLCYFQKDYVNQISTKNFNLSAIKASPACIESLSDINCYAPGEVVIDFGSSVSVQEINDFLLSIGSEQKAYTDEQIPIVGFSVVYKDKGDVCLKSRNFNEGDENSRAECSRLTSDFADQIIKQYNDMAEQKTQCCTGGLPFIEFTFKKPVSLEKYQEIIRSMQSFQELSDFNKTPDDSLEYSGFISGLGIFKLVVPQGQEKEIVCKIKSLNSPFIGSVYLDQCASFI